MYLSNADLSFKTNPTDTFFQNADINNGCNLNFPGCRYCTAWSCSRHGQANRIKIVQPWEGIRPIGNLFAGVFQFRDYTFTGEVSDKRDQLFYHLERDGFKVIFWTLHFLEKRPHLNLLALALDDCVVRSLIKSKYLSLWHQIQPVETSPRSGHNDTYFKPFFGNFTKWVRYVYQTGKKLLPSECSPVMSKAKGVRRKSYKMHGECKFIHDLRKEKRKQRILLAC